VPVATAAGRLVTEFVSEANPIYEILLLSMRQRPVEQEAIYIRYLAATRRGSAPWWSSIAICLDHDCPRVVRYPPSCAGLAGHEKYLAGLAWHKPRREIQSSIGVAFGNQVAGQTGDRKPA